MPLLIFPCNGNGIEALDCLGDAFQLLAFIDDTPEKQRTRPFGYPVWPRSALAEHPNAQVLAVPGSPTSYRSRRQTVDGLGLGLAMQRFATVVHPAARVSPLAVLGRNLLIMAGVVVTANATIGDHVCVLPNTAIHHDVTIGDWSLIGSNVTLAGHVAIGENCYIGSGTSVMNSVSVGAGALIGIGSNVIRTVPAGSTQAGNPARSLRP